MSTEVFVKKYWEEEDVLFYLHFNDGVAVRQIEISSQFKFFLSLENPVQGNSMLYDQSLESMNLNDSDFISKLEFETIWQNIG